MSRVLIISGAFLHRFVLPRLLKNLGRGVYYNHVAKFLAWEKPALLALISILAWATVGSAQEMEPRAYSRAPVGSQFMVFTYAYQTGDVLTDAALPLQDVSVKLNGVAFGYGRTFGLAGRQANVALGAAYYKGRASGTVFEDRQEVTRSGLGDVRVRFSTILIGGPALRPKEFAAYKPKALLGASMTVVMPTGQYDPRRLLNLGSNRWSFKPEVGLSKPFGSWTLELVGGVWLFTANNDFFGGVKREQKPIVSLQSHLIYTIRRRMWAALDTGYYTGGRTVVNGIINNDKQANSRIGGTFSLPLTQRQSFKVAFAKGLTTRFGGDMTTIVFGWQYAWVD